MASSSNSPSFRLLLLLLLFLISVSPHLSLGHETSRETDGREEVVRGGGRVLTGFKETPSGGNVTFDCSPSGPCIACLYSEKNDEKYRCSETGYRIPLKCVEIAKDRSSSITHRSLLADSSKSDGRSHAYITYRSCVPAANEEKLSVLGFEGAVLGLLLISSSVIYIKRKRSAAASGAVRIPTNSRF